MCFERLSQEIRDNSFCVEMICFLILCPLFVLWSAEDFSQKQRIYRFLRFCLFVFQNLKTLWYTRPLYIRIYCIHIYGRHIFIYELNWNNFSFIKSLSLRNFFQWKPFPFVKQMDRLLSRRGMGEGLCCHQMREMCFPFNDFNEYLKREEKNSILVMSWNVWQIFSLTSMSFVINVWTVGSLLYVVWGSPGVCLENFSTKSFMLQKMILLNRHERLLIRQLFKMVSINHNSIKFLC